MSFEEKLKRLKDFDNRSDQEWELYKNEWKVAILDLQQKIMNRWLKDYSDKKLIEFHQVPRRKSNPYIGEYLTMELEIILGDGTTVVLNPVNGVTSSYEGQMELYLLGSLDKKVQIIRNRDEQGQTEWFVGKRDAGRLELTDFNKGALINLIDEWLL